MNSNPQGAAAATKVARTDLYGRIVRVLLSPAYDARSLLLRELLSTAIKILAAFGLLIVFAAAIKAPLASVILVSTVLAIGAVMLYRRLDRAAAWTINSSFNYIGLGRLTEASELLDEAEAHPHFAWVRRLVDVQRAIIAMRRGELEEAHDRLNTAIARPLGLVARANSRYQIEGAYALRSFVRASLGDEEGALGDMDEVRRRPNASSDALARVALAEALLLERAGQRVKLKDLLQREETLLLEHTHPRERVIVRALQRMVRASEKASIYRMSAQEDTRPAEAEEPALADWAAQIAPGAAPFIRAPNRRTDADPAAVTATTSAVHPTREAVRAVEAARAAGAGLKTLSWLWVVLGVALAVMIQLAGMLLLGDMVSDGSGPSAGVVQQLPQGLWIAFLAAVAVSLGMIGLRAARASRRRSPGDREVSGAERSKSLREGEKAQFNELAGSPSDVVAAQAYLMLALEAERQASFANVIELCDKGLGRLAEPRSRAASDILYPDLVALRAFALAARGRNDEADAELASLGPTYPHHARAVFRVRLVQMLRRQDLAGAARWAEQGAGDLPLSVREELLVDIVRAAAAPAKTGSGEIERLKDELRRSPPDGRWLDVVAPGIIATFERSGEVDELPAMRVRVASPVVDATDKVDAVDAGALAELEVDETMRPATRARRRA